MEFRLFLQERVDGSVIVGAIIVVYKPTHRAGIGILGVGGTLHLRGEGVVVDPPDVDDAFKNDDSVFIKSLGIEFFASVEGVDTVLLLIYVCELCLAKSADTGVVKECTYLPLKALVELFKCLWCITVSPSLLAVSLVKVPVDAAHFGNEIRLSVIVLVIGAVDKYTSLSSNKVLVMLTKLCGILIIIVYVIDIC